MILIRLMGFSARLIIYMMIITSIVAARVWVEAESIDVCFAFDRKCAFGVCAVAFGAFAAAFEPLPLPLSCSTFFWAQTL